MAKPNAIHIHTFTERLIEAIKAKIILTIVEPRVWPVSRAVLCIPPAAPVRSTGVAITITILFGVWKKPKPTPQIAIRHEMFQISEFTGMDTKSSNPIMKITMPEAAVNAALCFSMILAAMGDIIIVAKGQGVMASPVCNSENFKTERKRKGKEIIVRFMAMNELVDVLILNAYNLLLKRSTGNMGWTLRSSLFT